MKVLVACEESQAVCKAFREKGHEAYSCDIQECSGGHPEWHIQGDVLKILNPSWQVIPGDKWFGFKFRTMDGTLHCIDGKWDMLIAHPPCTYLSNVATRHYSLRCTPADKVVERWDKRARSTVFFMQLCLADIPKIAVENPIGFMNTAYRKPDQIIHPYMFADSVEDTDQYVTKATCLWLHGLPKLKTNNLPKPNNGEIFGFMPSGKAKTWEDSYSRSGKVRSKTFPGIAKAMAEQWGSL